MTPLRSITLAFQLPDLILKNASQKQDSKPRFVVEFPILPAFRLDSIAKAVQPMGAEPGLASFWPFGFGVLGFALQCPK